MLREGRRSSVYSFPLYFDSRSFHHFQGRFCDFRTDAVTRDKGYLVFHKLSQITGPDKKAVSLTQLPVTLATLVIRTNLL